MIGWDKHLWSYEQKSVSATFACQLDDLEEHCPSTSSFLRLLSFFDPESIPVDMIVLGARSLPLSQGPLSTTQSAYATTSTVLGNLDSLLRKFTAKTEESMTSTKLKTLVALILSHNERQDAMMQLQNRSLIKHLRGADISTLRIHDLTRVMIQERSSKSGDEQEWFELAVALCCGAFSQRVEDPESPGCWPHCAIFIPHIQELTRRDNLYGNRNATLAETDMNIVRYLRSCGRYYNAETLCEQLLVVGREHLGVKHPKTLAAMNTLAHIYNLQGRHSDAETLYNQVLPVAENILGKEHVSTLAFLHNLAQVYESQGRYSDAETLYNRVLPVEEKILGKEHPSTLTTMHNLAHIYNLQGRYSDAETLYNRVLPVEEKILGKEHPSTLTTMKNFAQVYESQGRYSDAETLYNQVLPVKEKILGKEHPSTLTTMHSLAQVYGSQGRYSDAETLYDRVLSVQENILSREHPLTLATMNNLAHVYESQGRYSDAETLYNQVLPVLEKILGKEHPSTLTTMNNLAQVYESQGRHSDAETLYNQVLPVEEKILGKEHPSTLTTMNNLAQVYESQGRYSDAETLFKRVLAIQERILGVAHQHTSTTSPMSVRPWHVTPMLRPFACEHWRSIPCEISTTMHHNQSHLLKVCRSSYSTLRTHPLLEPTLLC
jgi:tetratricopeptide (TPR) repeat protein